MLNEDILYAIMDCLACSDGYHSTVASLMHLSRAIYHAGGKVLAAEVQLDTPSHVASFIQFCRAERGLRLPYVRNLTLSVGSLLPDLAASLEDLVKKMTHLRRLCLLNAEQLLESSENMVSAFQSLEELKEIEIRAGGKLSQTLLGSIRCSLTAMTLDFGDYTLIQPSLLGHSRSSVESIAIINSRLPITVGEAPYSAVRRLLLSAPIGSSLSVRPYIACFPNLTNLTIIPRWREGNPPQAASSYPITKGRRTAQRLVNQRFQQVMGSWNGLAEVNGTVHAIWALGLACRAEKLALEMFGVDDEMDHIIQLLQEARPRILELSTSIDNIRKNIFGKAVVGIEELESVCILLELPSSGGVQLEREEASLKESTASAINSGALPIYHVPLTFKSR